MLTVMMIGDIMGKPGRRILGRKLPGLIERYQPDMVIANGENAAGGVGITEDIAREFYGLGVDVITLGNHSWDNRGVFDFIDKDPRLIRPANFPAGAPGRGWTIHEIHPARRPVAVVSLQGRVFMTPLDCPFQTADRVLAEIRDAAPGSKAPLVIVDFHAEATSEKETLGFYLAGRVAALAGTHTHVQTADERVLAGGTAYISDLGMTGPRDTVLGVRPAIMIRRFLSQMPVRHEVGEGTLIMSGAVIQLNEDSGGALYIERFNELIEESPGMQR